MTTRALRGAITVKNNTREDILEGTALLLNEVLIKNDINPEDITSIIFTLTSDLNAVFPAVAAREAGLTEVPLMCMQEIPVPGSLQMCVRILLHFNTEMKNSDLKHIYLRGATVLRPDISDRK